MASNLVWPGQPADRGRWRWMMQPVIPASGASGVPPVLYVFEKNPNKMDSPFAEIASADSSRQPFPDNDGLYNTVLLRTKFQLGEFSVDGKIWSKDQYDKMQAYYDWPGLVAIRDHFGRVFVVRLMDFDVRPQIRTARRQYKFEYKLQCQLYQFSDSAGNVVENAANIGMVFNGFGPGTTTVAAFDAAVAATSYTVVHKQALPSNWQDLSDASDYRDRWATHVSSWEAIDEYADRYSVIVLDGPSAFYESLSRGGTRGRHTVTGIAEALRGYLSGIQWGEISVALGVNPHSVLAAVPYPLSMYAGAFRNFKSLLADASPRLIPVARYPWTQMKSATFGGMLTDAPVACLYIRFDSSVSMATMITDLAAFRKTAFTKGSLFALTLSINGATSDGKSPDEVLSKMYQEARKQLPGQAQLAFFAYEDYVTAVPSTPNMVAAYQGIYLGAETVTDAMVGRL